MGSASLILKGILLGLGAAVPIGPVNVEIVRRTLRGGFFAGFALGCGAVTVDVCYAILSSLGFGLLLNRPIFYWPLSVGGIALLTYLGVMCWIGALRARQTLTEAAEGAEPGQSSTLSGYITGLLMTLLNPMTLGFW